MSDLCFSSRDFSSLTARLSAFHLVSQTSEASEKLRNKTRLWYKALAMSLQPSASNIMHMIDLDSATTHVEWVSSEASMEGITTLLANLCRETHPLLAYLLSLVRHNSRER